MARTVLGPKAIIGISIETLDQAKQYKHSSADYFGIGPVFSTSSKSDAAVVLGMQNFEYILEILHTKSCVAIGGINHQTITLFPFRYLHGVAVISAICQASDPFAATRQLMELLP